MVLRATESGVRSSCEASLTKRFCSSSARARRPSISVTAATKGSSSAGVPPVSICASPTLRPVTAPSARAVRPMGRSPTPTSSVVTAIVSSPMMPPA